MSDTRSHSDQGKRTNMACPHCGGALRTRTSRSVTPTYRQFVFACFNADCGATFGAEMTITHAISPSARPNPDVRLRQAPPRHRRQAPANDTVPARSTAPGEPLPPPVNDEVNAGTG